MTATGVPHENEIREWQEKGLLTDQGAEIVRTFSRFLARGITPPLTVLDLLRLPADERQFVMPGYGPLDQPCDYCPGMGV